MSRYSMRSESGKLLFIGPSASQPVFIFLLPVVAAIIFHRVVHVSQQLDKFHRFEFTILITLATCLWLWMVAGKDELEFTPTELTHRRLLFGIGRTHIYHRGDIQGPHFVVRVP